MLKEKSLRSVPTVWCDASNPNVIIQVFKIKRKDKCSRAQVLCTLRNEVLIGWEGLCSWRQVLFFCNSIYLFTSYQVKPHTEFRFPFQSQITYFSYSMLQSQTFIVTDRAVLSYAELARLHTGWYKNALLWVPLFSGDPCLSFPYWPFGLEYRQTLFPVSLPFCCLFNCFSPKVSIEGREVIVSL